MAQSKSQLTQAKRARERARLEKRTLKEERKAARKQAAAELKTEDAAPGYELETGDAAQALEFELETRDAAPEPEEARRAAAGGATELQRHQGRREAAAGASTCGRPRGNLLPDGGSCATHVPPIVHALHPGTGHTESSAPCARVGSASNSSCTPHHLPRVDPLVILDDSRRSRNDGRPGLSFARVKAG